MQLARLCVISLCVPFHLWLSTSKNKEEKKQEAQPKKWSRNQNMSRAVSIWVSTRHLQPLHNIPIAIMEPPAVNVGLGFQRSGSRLVPFSQSNHPITCAIVWRRIVETLCWGLIRHLQIMLRLVMRLMNYREFSLICLLLINIHIYMFSDNFLETISPQQGTCSLELNTNHVQNDLDSSTLSPGISDQRF